MERKLIKIKVNTDAKECRKLEGKNIPHPKEPKALIRLLYVRCKKKNNITELVYEEIGKVS